MSSILMLRIVSKRWLDDTLIRNKAQSFGLTKIAKRVSHLDSAKTSNYLTTFKFSRFYLSVKQCDGEVLKFKIAVVKNTNAGIINPSIYFTRRVTAEWSQRKTTWVIEVCCTNGIHLQIKAQHKFKHKKIFNRCAGLHKM